jgi:hypothetical protein
MPDTTITGLPNASALSGTERVPMDQGGVTVDAAASAIAALATAATVGLGSVNNTSDLNKPVSTATQAALDAKAATGAIGSSGLTMTAGVLGRESGTGAPVVLTLGSGLSIVGGALTAAGGGGGSGTVTSVGLSAPTGFAVAGSPITASGTLALTFAAGYSLPTTAKQTEWDTAAVLAGTAVQPAGLTSYVQTSDARLSDSREWSATTISQAEAEAGSATTRRAFTAQRVFQAAAAWWAATATATGQALATAANAAAARTTLGLGTAAQANTGDFATPAALSSGLAGKAETGLIGSSGLTMSTNRILLRTTAGTGAIEEGTLGGGLSFSGTTLAFSDVIKLVVSNKGETATVATNYVETTVQRACTVIGAFWELAPSATGSSSSQAMLYARRSGTKTSLLSANASLASSAILTDATSLLTGSLTLAAGDTLGVDLVSVGTGSSGHIFTITVRYS